MPITLKHKGDIQVTNGTVSIDGVPISGAQGPQGIEGSQGPQGIAGSTGPLGTIASGTNYIYVAADGTDTQNATELQAAYDAAKLMTPSASNRIVIVSAPGYYNFGTSTFIMDTEYIDLVSLDGNRSVVFNAAGISVTANDVFVKGVDVGTNAFAIGDSLNFLRIENCKGGSYSFTATSGTITVSGIFIDCTGGTDSFGSVTGTASGTFINCTSGSGSFGLIASGFFRNCDSPANSFGQSNPFATSGTFIQCTGGDNCFGFGGTASGNFTNCTAGVNSFGGGSGTASGTFINCVGGIYSFGGDTSLPGNLTGNLYYCRLTAGLFPVVSSGGRTYYCVDGNGDPNNQ